MGRPLGRKTIEILTPQRTTDPYSGQPVDDWSAEPDAVAVKGCEVQPGASQEYLLNRDSELVAWTVFAPPGTDVTTYNRVRYKGDIYTVYGHPADWDSTSGRIDYVEIILQDWRG